MEVIHVFGPAIWFTLLTPHKPYPNPSLPDFSPLVHGLEDPEEYLRMGFEVSASSSLGPW
ncbi:CFA_G0004860.mRNA.1.CDS.1 [Saccharomyces cerevisiae]|nr:CFA_G0004860.mRNA.1.CDS.1 [Saccharomyces cerevisiae]CAI7161686.1 CFA_G0004860.mRNA.1.CDS.1 [Saccharomyces cerevisiae]